MLARLIFSILIILPSVTYSAYPTVEGLFSAPYNPDLKVNALMYSFCAESTRQNDLINQDGFQEVVKTGYCPKLIFNKTDNEYKLLQIDYLSNKFNKTDVFNVNKLTSFRRTLANEQINEKKLIYSLIVFLTMSDNSLLYETLTSFGVVLERNNDILDQSKKNLLKKYKNYLIAKKDKDSTALEEIKDPTKSDLAENQKAINETLKKRLYKKSELVKLEKIESDFYWVVRTNNFEARFSNNDNRLVMLAVTTPNDQISIVLGDYVSIGNNNISIPKKIVLNSSKGTLELTSEKIYPFNVVNNQFAKRVKNYMKLLEDNKSKVPDFTYQNMEYFY